MRVKKRVTAFAVTPEFNWRPQGDSNPRYRRERAVSWAGLDDGDGFLTTYCKFQIANFKMQKETRLKFALCILHIALTLTGEPAGTRTQDTRLKRAVLYQLSYRPAFPRRGV